MFPHQPRDGPTVEVAEPGYTIGRQLIHEDRPQFVTQPRGGRSHEATLASAQLLGQEARRDRLLEETFAGPRATDLYRLRQRVDVLDQLVIDERHAQFERV